MLIGERFWKAPFSVTENAVSVWTVGLTGEKKMRFKFTRVSVDGALFQIYPG